MVADQRPIEPVSEVIANGAQEVLASEAVLAPSIAATEDIISPSEADSLRVETSQVHVATESLQVAEPAPIHVADVGIEAIAPISTGVVQPGPQESVSFAVSHEPVIQVDAELIKEVFPVADVALESTAEAELRLAEVPAEDVVELGADLAVSQVQVDTAIISEQLAQEDRAPVIQVETAAQEIAHDEAPELTTLADSIPTDTTADAPVSEVDFQESSHEIEVQQSAEIPEGVEISKPVSAVAEALPEVDAFIVSPVVAEAPALMIAEPVKEIEASVEPVEPVEPAVLERELITVAAIEPSPIVPIVRPQRFLSRTLWLLLAGVAGGTLAGWWVSAQAGPLLPTASASASVMLPADLPADLPLQAVATPNVSLLPVTPSTPILVIPSVPPSAELLRIAEGPTSMWLPSDEVVAAVSPWPVVVPWTACLPHPVVPSSIVSFADAPIFTGLPQAAWAQGQAWAWCAGGTWAPPIRPRFADVVPQLAFVLPLQVPAHVAGWLVEPDLRLMPIAVFGEPLGWSVLARPQLLVPTSFIVAVPPIMPAIVPADDSAMGEMEVPGDYLMSPDFEEFWFEPQATPVVVEPIP